MICVKVKIQTSAQRDLDHGYYFYEQQEVGVGEYFFNMLISESRALKVTAGIHFKRGKLFRVKSKKFPYWIYYATAAEVVRVVAILDARQSPEKILRREKREQVSKK